MLHCTFSPRACEDKCLAGHERPKSASSPRSRPRPAALVVRSPFHHLPSPSAHPRLNHDLPRWSFCVAPCPYQLLRCRCVFLPARGGRPRLVETAWRMFLRSATRIHLTITTPDLPWAHWCYASYLEMALRCPTSSSAPPVLLSSPTLFSHPSSSDLLYLGLAIPSSRTRLIKPPQRDCWARAGANKYGRANSFSSERSWCHEEPWVGIGLFQPHRERQRYTVICPSTFWGMTTTKSRGSDQYWLGIFQVKRMPTSLDAFNLEVWLSHVILPSHVNAWQPPVDGAVATNLGVYQHISSPLRASLGDLALRPGCSCSSVCWDALVPIPSP